MTKNSFVAEVTFKYVSTFDFPTLYPKRPHDKLLAVLNAIFEFAFRGGTRDKICVLKNTAYWIENNMMNGNRYSLTSVKKAVKYLLENCFFNVGSQIFC